VLGAAAAAAFVSVRARTYSASAAVTVEDQALNRQLFQIGVANNPQQDAATTVALANSRDVAVQAARSVDIPAAAIARGVSASESGTSTVVVIRATFASGAEAAAIANAYAAAFITLTRNRERAGIDAAEAVLRQQLAALPANQANGAVAHALQTQIGNLAGDAAFQSADGSIVQTATRPGTPDRPSRVAAAIVGAVLGAILGGVVAYLLARFDPRIRRHEELEYVMGASLLADFRRKDLGVAGNRDPDAACARQLRILEARIRFGSGEPPPRIVMFSTWNSEAESGIIAWQTAVAAAESGQRVAFVAAGLATETRQAPLADAEVPARSPVLVGGSSSATQSLDASRRVSTVDLQSGAHFDLVSLSRDGGTVRQRPGGELARLVEEARSRYDVVIVDTSPLSHEPDAYPLFRHADAVVAVASLGTITLSEAAEYAAQLRALRAQVTGLIAVKA
jgi:Mrp family chromosome partitioning ATPase/capsular polysaccharide biosynthesis protein